MFTIITIANNGIKRRDKNYEELYEKYTDYQSQLSRCYYDKAGYIARTSDCTFQLYDLRKWVSEYQKLCAKKCLNKVNNDSIRSN